MKAFTFACMAAAATANVLTAAHDFVSSIPHSRQDAKARFSELLNACLDEGPQIVTRRGVPTAVLAPIEQWRIMEHRARPNLKDLLLAAESRVEHLVPPRRRQAGREASGFG